MTAKTDLEEARKIFFSRFYPIYRFYLQINTETKDARESADQTAEAVENLQSKLNKLQKKFLKNAHDAKEIKIQADAVKDSASNTHDKAKKVSER